jgi:hypothetical protein
MQTFLSSMASLISGQVSFSYRHSVAARFAIVSPHVVQLAIPGQDRCARNPRVAKAPGPLHWERAPINFHFQAVCSEPEDSRITVVEPQGRAVTDGKEFAN